MSFITSFISQYGTTILYAMIVAIGGWLGMQFKKIYEKLSNDKVKKEIVETCVKAAEQLYKNLHGEDKFNAMCNDVAEMAVARGITITGIEIRMLAESALCEFNKAFEGVNDSDIIPTENEKNVDISAKPVSVEESAKSKK